MKNVFISFSSRETAEAQAICNFLEENQISCFISTRDLIPGEEYAMQLLKNIDDANVVVLILSENSNKSPHVLREIEYAVSHKVPIIVYELEHVTLTKSMEYFLMTHQWITVSSSMKQQLLEGIHYLLGGGASASQSENKSDEKAESRSSKALLYALIGSCCCCVCLLAIILIMIFSPKTSDTEDRGLSANASGELEESQTEFVNPYKLGDSVTFGSYYGEPIEWRVLKINDDNSMVLISRDILTIKSFDAPEAGNYNYYEGVDYWSYENHIVTDESLVIKIRGNNDWSISNIRTWLNSDKELVKYEDQAPTKKAVGSNYYHTEPGFLYEFSEEEKAALLPTTNLSTANTFSENVTDGQVSTEDLVYLLSSEELRWFEEAGMHIYAAPNEKCEEHDEYRSSYTSFTESYHTDHYYWWLRDNPREKINEVYIVVTEQEDGKSIRTATAGSSAYGVRPAVTVDITTLSSFDQHQ